MATYYLNLTIHCLKEDSEAILKHIREELLPVWRNEGSPKTDLELVKVYVPAEDQAAYALRWSVEDRDPELCSEIVSNPHIRKLMEAFPERVFPFPVLMEVLEL